ncbi:hypothetical protein DL240_05620 [Lujinxingia litoralis]|uniref:HD/PDEase domain-containing protein n=1 Tax=Lujinxingia litoralis TaxID=2211119 RepID=A0A328C9M2_9DELT|nr:HD domain-containing protein [Lujinxingia litoralis]RAL23638.1 hypothetical protein DL240_05620 [Lujinxingia litoralis]
MARSKVYIADLEDNAVVESTFLLAAKSIRETRSGDPYLSMTLQDRSGTIEVRAWDNALMLDKRADIDDFVAIRGRVSSYRDKLQITITDMERIDDASVDLADYMPHSRWSADGLFEQLRSLLTHQIQSPEVLRFLNALLDDPDFARRYKQAPAAVTNHHNFLGGLLEHTLSMARLGLQMARHYQAYYPGLVDSDLVIAGVVLHDMGKVEELSYRRSFDYTTEGRMVGHIARGAEIVGQVAAALTPELDPDLVTHLKHLVLSHHGRMEYGSPVTPRTAEAMLLHFLDMIDSRMNMCWNACEPLVSGASASGGWSDYRRALEGFMFVQPAPAGGRWGQEGRVMLQDTEGPGLATNTSPEPEARPVAEPSSARAAEPRTPRPEDKNLSLFGE